MKSMIENMLGYLRVCEEELKEINDLILQASYLKEHHIPKSSFKNGKIDLVGCLNYHPFLKFYDIEIDKDWVVPASYFNLNKNRRIYPKKLWKNILNEN
jgi:hypothetical protein